MNDKEAKEHPQTLYDAVEVLYHYAETLAMHTEFSQWMHTAGVYDPQELTDSHMSTMGIAAYQTWKAWYSIKHPILKPAVEAIASAALTSLSVTASQTSKEEYEIVEWMRQMLWDGLTEDLEMLRENKLHGSSEVPAEPQTEKPEEVPSETEKEDNEIPINSCLYDVNIECSGGYRYFDISDEERELIKKKICTKCRDGKCVIMDDVICPKGSYGASNCSDCDLRPRSPAQEFFAMQAQKVREARKAQGWSEEPELSPWQRRSQTEKSAAYRRCIFDLDVKCPEEVFKEDCSECEHRKAAKLEEKS